jgi:hypothetical protein
VQFRKWATRVALEFTIKGFAMDDERLERGNTFDRVVAETKRLAEKTDAPKPGRKKERKKP